MTHEYKKTIHFISDDLQKDVPGHENFCMKGGFKILTL